MKAVPDSEETLKVARRQGDGRHTHYNIQLRPAL